MKILDFIFPPTCPICGASVSDHGTICHDCFAKFNWISNPKCCVCGYPFPSNIDLGDKPLCPVCSSGKNELDWMRSACVYDDFSRSVMLQFKHAGALKYKHIMSRSMISLLKELNYNIDIVLPVPLSTLRMFKRGYNQATVLAAPIAKSLNVKIDLKSIKRKYRSDMGHKNAKQRAENIHGVFSIIKSENIKGKSILLVDDVFTTGATFSELRKVLMKSGARAVYGITFCRVVRAI